MIPTPEMIEAVKEIADLITKAMEGVSAGKWCQFHPLYAPEAEGTPFSVWDSSHDMSAVSASITRKRIATFKHADDAAYVDAVQPDNIRILLSALADAERERDELRIGIKRLSDEEEMCSETDGGDAFDLVRLAAKLARSERETRDAERELTDTQTAIHAMSEDYAALKATLSTQASLLEEARRVIEKLAESGLGKYLRTLVAGWDGENLPEHQRFGRHPETLGSTVPTTVGEVYALDEGLRAASSLLLKLEGSSHAKD